MTEISGASDLHCVLDARPAMRQGTGIGTYVEGLLSGLANLEDRPALTVFTASWKDRPRQRLIELTRAAGGSSVHRRLPVRLLNWSWHHLRRPAVESLIAASIPDDSGRLVAHSPHPLTLPSRKGRSVVTVHDLYFLEHPEQTFAEVRRDYPRLLERSLRDADAVICVSAHTRAHLLERYGDSLGDELRRKSFVVPNGIDLEFFRPDPSGPGAAAGPYLAVGRIEPRKNPIRLLEAYARAGTEAPLVWAGAAADDHWQRTLDDAIDRLHLGDRVQVLGYVDRATLRDLYRGARALLYPSLHEGFGLPILEAMACGCPVLTANRTAMPEVAGDAALTVDPESVDAIRLGIEQLEDPGCRESLREAGFERAKEFSWSRCAQRTVEIYRLQRRN